MHLLCANAFCEPGLQINLNVHEFDWIAMCYTPQLSYFYTKKKKLQWGKSSQFHNCLTLNSGELRIKRWANAERLSGKLYQTGIKKNWVVKKKRMILNCGKYSFNLTSNWMRNMEGPSHFSAYQNKWKVRNWKLHMNLFSLCLTRYHLETKCHHHEGAVF